MAADTIDPAKSPDDRFEYRGPGGAYAAWRRGAQWLYAPIGSPHAAVADNIDQARDRARAMAEKRRPNCDTCGHTGHPGRCGRRIGDQDCPCGKTTYTAHGPGRPDERAGSPSETSRTGAGSVVVINTCRCAP